MDLENVKFVKKMNNYLNKLDVPFDLVMFPSMGVFYPNKKQGVLVRYLTAIEENILTAPMLSSTPMALDMTLSSVIIDDDIKVDDLLIGDKNAILLFLRSTSFGDEYPVFITCPSCNQTGKTSFYISSMQAKDIYDYPDDEGLYTYIPRMKLNNQPVVIKFRPMTYGDEKFIKQQLEIEKANPRSIPRNITLRYSNQIVSINGATNREIIEKFITKMPIKESQALRDYMDKMEPGIDSKVILHCEKCSHRFKEDFALSDQFLGLTPEYKNALWEEIFLWYYYGKGVSRDEAFRAATAERKWAIERINEEIERKNKAEKDAHEAANRKGKR